MPWVLLESKERSERLWINIMWVTYGGQLLYNECDVSLRYYDVLPVKWIIVSYTLVV